MNDCLTIAEQFSPGKTVRQVREFGSGNINATFLVTLDSVAEKHFILQQLNPRVFPRPEGVMHNLRTCIAHVRDRLAQTPLPPGRRWEMVRVLRTRNGADLFRDKAGSCWRALTFINHARSFDTIRDESHAREIGYGLGLFHALLNDLPPGRLTDTLAGFHITPGYLDHYDRVLAAQNPAGSPEVNYCLDSIHRSRVRADVLEKAKARGLLKPRPIHGDPKINNFMIDNTTGRVVSLIDLDTVQPGLVQYDIGDCLRSGCNPLGERPGQWQQVRFEPDLCRAILQGYFTMAGRLLTDNDFSYLYDAVRLLTFELGLRFFTDYLEGNVYFKADRPEHNLARALVQFRLLASIESQAGAIRAIIRELR
ncbi:MAG: aminoglycoside phosphotransferase family protein [Desulfobacterales bacterium]|nr:aminoglycoside phosphotransferase family protein [Desulfobacterales bacterium]